MAWWPFSKKASAAGPILTTWNVGQPVWTPRRMDVQADEGFIRNSVGFRCTKLISSSGASANWLLFNGKTKLDEHPLLSLMERPSPLVSWNAMCEALIAYLLLSGVSYLEAVGPDGKPPMELWNLRPDRMKVIPGLTGIPRAFEYELDGRKVRWDVDQITGIGPVLQIKEFHPLNDWYGLSRVDPAAYGIDRHNAASAHNKALLDNGAAPSGALVLKPVKAADGSEQSAPGPAIEAAANALMKNHAGARNAGRPFVFGGNVDWLPFGLSPKDMDFGEGKADAARDICLSFGVPHILVVPGSQTYNNIREAKLELWEDTVLPLLDKVADSLNIWLTPRFGDKLRLVPDLDSISALEPRRESKRKSTMELLEKGVIDDDEARETLQFGPRRPEGIKKVDASVLATLASAAKADPAMLEPLFRYMRSVQLISPEITTIEQLLSVADAWAPDTQEDAVDALPPDAGAQDDAV